MFSSLGIWAYGLFSTPVFMLRTILWGTLLSAILVAIGVSRLPGYAAYAALLCVLAGFSAGVIGYFRTNHAENEQWRQAVAFFSENQQPNDILLFRNTYVASTFAYYLHSYSQGWDIFGWDCSGEKLFPAEVVQASPVNRVELHHHAPATDLPLAPKAGASLWVIEAHCWPRDWKIADDVFYPNWRLVGSHKFKGVNLHQLAPAIGR